MTYEMEMKHIAYLAKKEEHETLVNLYKSLKNDNRIDDFDKAVDDPKLFNALCEEYGLGTAYNEVNGR